MKIVIPVSVSDTVHIARSVMRSILRERPRLALETRLSSGFTPRTVKISRATDFDQWPDMATVDGDSRFIRLRMWENGLYVDAVVHEFPTHFGYQREVGWLSIRCRHRGGELYISLNKEEIYQLRQVEKDLADGISADLVDKSRKDESTTVDRLLPQT